MAAEDDNSAGGVQASRAYSAALDILLWLPTFRFGTCGRGVEKRSAPQDLREVLDEPRDALAGPERLRAVERARATIEEAVGVEMFVGNLRSGSTSADGAWMNRRFGAA